MMKKLFLCALLLTSLAAYPAGNGSSMWMLVAEASMPVTADNSQPDVRFASLDSLVDYMTNRYINTPEDLVGYYNEASLAMKSYWQLNHQGGDPSGIDDEVCNELMVLADSLSFWSTMDMVQSNLIGGAVSQYNTAKAYIARCGDSFYQDEMREWMALENKLADYYSDVAYLANWGGSIAHVISTGSYNFLASVRQEDYSGLFHGAQFESCDRTLSELRAELIHQLAGAKAFAAEPYDDDIRYTSLAEHLCQTADELPLLFDKWQAARARLCKSQGIPESHTASLVAQLISEMHALIED